MSKRIRVLFAVVAVMIAVVAVTPGASGVTDTRAGLCFGMVPTITGTSASEVINGTNGDDVIFAGGGNDTVNGLGGNDRICGSTGDDTLNGGLGNDKIKGGGGNDILNGNEGDDKLKGGGGNDTLSGIPGTDIDLAGKGTDACDSGDDVFKGCESFFGTPTPPPPANTLDWTLPAGQSLSLPQGWTGADPRTFGVTAGGTISTAYLNSDPNLAPGQGDCTGFAIQGPDFEFTYTGGASQPRLRFFWKPNSPGTANGTGDAVLIINSPNGKWYCNDDFAGLNPQITFSGATYATGTYDVWVAKRGGSNAGGTLSITELDINVTP